MGDHYEFTELAEVPYIEHRSAKTNWQSEALKLTPEQYEKVQDYFEKEYEARKELLSKIVNG